MSTEHAKLALESGDELLDIYLSSDVKVYQAAHEALCAAGQAALAMLVPMFGHSNAIVRMRAVNTIAWLKAERNGAVPALIALLQDSSADVCERAAFALGQIKPNLPAVIPALLVCLRTGDATRQAAALHALGNIGKRDAALVREYAAFLQHPNHDLRWSAAYAISSTSGDLKSVARLLMPLLMDSAPRNVFLALDSLAKYPLNGKTVELLATLVNHHDSSVRIRALEVLARYGPTARPIAPVVYHCMGNANDEARLWAAQAIWSINRQPQEVIPVLLEALKGEEQAFVCDILTSMGREAEAAVPRLIDILKEHQDVDACWAAIDALGAIGAVAVSAIPTLIEMFAIPTSILGDAAVSALFRIGQAAIAPLIEALGSRRERVQEFAADAVSRFGKAAQRAMASLRVLSQSPKLGVRLWSVIAMLRIEPDERICDGLKECIELGDSSLMRVEAMRGYVRLEKDNASVIALGREFVNDEDTAVRDEAREVLGKLTGDSFFIDAGGTD